MLTLRILWYSILVLFRIKTEAEVRIEFRRIQGNVNQIRVLTYQPGRRDPIETIADAVALRKRKVNHSAVAGQGS